MDKSKAKPVVAERQRSPQPPVAERQRSPQPSVAERQRSPQPSEAEQQCSPQHQPPAAERQHSLQTNAPQKEWSKPRRDKRICGAEAKRRRKARQEQERADGASLSGRAPPPPQPTKQAQHLKGVPPSGRDVQSSKKAEHPKGQQPKKRAEHPQGVPPSKKRNRSGTSSEATPGGHKRAKQGPRPGAAPPTSYKEAALGHLRVAIIDKDNPYGKIPKDKEVLVKNALKGELDKTIFSTPSSSNTQPPVFRSWTYSGEIVRIVCEDDHTLGWLTKTVAELRPWEEAALAVVRTDQLPRLTKATLWIPVEAESDHEEKEVVVGRLAGQNPAVDVRRWCVFHYEAKVTPRGHLLVLGIGDEDMKILRARAMRVHYLFQSLVLRVKHNTAQEEATEMEADEAEPSARTDATSPTPGPSVTPMEVVSPLATEEETTKE